MGCISIGRVRSEADGRGLHDSQVVVSALDSDTQVRRHYIDAQFRLMTGRYPSFRVTPKRGLHLTRSSADVLDAA